MTEDTIKLEVLVSAIGIVGEIINRRTSSYIERALAEEDHDTTLLYGSIAVGLNEAGEILRDALQAGADTLAMIGIAS